MRDMLRLIAAVMVAGARGALPADYKVIPMNGVNGKMDMPLVGLGVWQYNSSRAEEAVLAAFKVGYRHVDTAFVYKNQVGVGAALKKLGLPREDYFITSKIPGGLNASATEAHLDQCLHDLDQPYVDLMLVHFPGSFDGKGSVALRREQWLAMEKWAKSGKARAIGVSHYCKSHIEDILAVNTVPIALNQVMYHVGMGKSPDVATDYKSYVQSKGIVYMAFSSLCGPCEGKESKELLDGPLVTEIGKAHNKTGAQVALKWVVQQGIPVIPKSTNPVHLAEDFDLFSFNLTDEETARLTAATTPKTGADTSGDCDIKEIVV